MRATLRLFAVVKPATRFLEPGAPTGLTGLYTHSSPRTALIYTYSSTLDKLRHFPESSVYRISTEALTKHRLSIVESYLPEGYEAWQDRVRTHIEKHKDLYAQLGYGKEQVLDGRHFFPMQRQEALTDETDDYDGAPPNQAVMLTPTDEAQREWLVSEIMKPKMTREAAETMALEPEPQLSTDQIKELEDKLGAGLIEEVIQVAQGEDKLVQTMSQNQVWEDLAEPAPEGQWSYHERRVATSTQKP